ncbi:ribonuclease Z [Desulfovibrionales bacterium]
MQITFVGVGEAFDEILPNCSVLATTEAAMKRTSVLLDCGFTAATSYWRLAAFPTMLDALWISHFHGDHFFGIPALLLRMHEEGRQRPLAVLGQSGVADRVITAIDLAYPGTRHKFLFPLEFYELATGKTLACCGFIFTTATSEHSQPNLALRLDANGRSLFYSGDGLPTPTTTSLARGVDLIVHESFSMEQNIPGHGTVPGSIALAREAGVQRIAIVHVQREVRHSRQADILALCADAVDVRAFLPEPGDIITI